MLTMFKKAFWVPYEDSDVYSTDTKAHQAISKYCEENGAHRWHYRAGNPKRFSAFLLSKIKLYSIENDTDNMGMLI